MTHLVRCPNCREPIRVGAADLGRDVTCPQCGRPFPAALPVARPTADADSSFHPDPPPSDPAGPTPALLGLALLPWGIPLVWFLAPLVLGAEPVFTLALPVAAAVGLSGLAVGLAAGRWSHATRVRAVLALVLVGYATAAGLYLLQPGWVEAVRGGVARNKDEWKAYKPADGAYTVRFPGPASAAGESPLPGWPLATARWADDRPAPDVYTAAHGRPPAGHPAGEEAWFAAIRAAVLADTGGDLRAERVVPAGGPPNRRRPTREYVVRLPDGVTNRVVRVVRGRGVAFYLSAEGPFLPADAKDVEQFFGSFELLK